MRVLRDSVSLLLVMLEGQWELIWVLVDFAISKQPMVTNREIATRIGNVSGHFFNLGISIDE